MYTFDVGEYTTKSGCKAVIKFILPPYQTYVKSSTYNSIGYIQLSSGETILAKWDSEGRNPCDIKYDLKVPRKVSWKVECGMNGYYSTYGPYSTKEIAERISKENNGGKLIQCVELNPGERLVGNKIEYVGDI